MPFIKQFNGKQPSGGPERRVERGAIDNARRSLVSVLEDRFQTVPAELLEQLDSIDDPQRLTLLMRNAVKVPTLKDFISFLNS